MGRPELRCAALTRAAAARVAGLHPARIPTAAALLTGLVVGITDGDTLTGRCEVPRGLQTFKVRLTEIDAPETGQPFGKRSKQNLSKLCFQKPALLQAQGTDRYGRLPARLECDGIDANTAQVIMGRSWATTSTSPMRRSISTGRRPKPSFGGCGPKTIRCRPGNGGGATRGAHLFAATSAERSQCDHRSDRKGCCLRPKTDLVGQYWIGADTLDRVRTSGPAELLSG